MVVQRRGSSEGRFLGSYGCFICRGPRWWEGVGRGYLCVLEGQITFWVVVVVYIYEGRLWEIALCEKWSRCSEGARGR